VKFSKNFIITISIIIFAVLTLAGFAIWKAKRPPVEVGREVIRDFSFSGAKGLSDWEDKLLARNRTDYSVVEEAGKGCVKAQSEDSASALFYQHKLLFLKRPFVSWDWRVAKFPERQQQENLDKKEEFDFGAQFYVIFASRFFLNTKAIQYVWTEKMPVGTVSDSPYTKNVKIMVLESGPSDEWKHEERNIEEDFRNLFGQELSKNVAAVALMTDSDSTGTSALAYFSNVVLGYLGMDLSKRKRHVKKKLVRSKRFPFRKIEVEVPEEVEPVKKVEPVKEVAPVKEAEPVAEPVKEIEPAVEPVKEVVPVKEAEPVKEEIPVKEAEPVEEAEPAKKAEPIKEEPAAEPVKESEQTKEESH
jgi:hypothetical protein